jgi:predicted RNase H-like HicB family nuclease
MKTYLFQVVVEPDEDVWHAYCPALVSHGGSTWGMTREEAMKHIQEVVKLVVESLIEHGEEIPEGPSDLVEVLADSRVAITV